MCQFASIIYMTYLIAGNKDSINDVNNSIRRFYIGDKDFDDVVKENFAINYSHGYIFTLKSGCRV